MKNQISNKVLIVIIDGLITLTLATMATSIYYGIKICWLDNPIFLKQSGQVLMFYGSLWAMWLFPNQSTYTQTSKKRNALNAAIRTSDKKKFMRYVDIQISWVTDLQFMVTCSSILLMAFLVESEKQEGVTIFFLSSLIMIATRLIYLLRDNPLEGVYLLSPFKKFIPIGIWELNCLNSKWREDALRRNPQ